MCLILSDKSLVSRTGSDPATGDDFTELGDVLLPGGGGTFPFRTALADGALGAFLPQ